VKPLKTLGEVVEGFLFTAIFLKANSKMLKVEVWPYGHGSLGNMLVIQICADNLDLFKVTFFRIVT